MQAQLTIIYAIEYKKNMVRKWHNFAATQDFTVVF